MPPKELRKKNLEVTERQLHYKQHKMITASSQITTKKTHETESREMAKEKKQQSETVSAQ